MSISVSPKLGVNTVAELVTRVKANPYKLIIGTTCRSLPHLAAKMFVERTGAPMIVAPATGGTSEAIREIMGGHTHVVVEAISGIRGAVASGDIKPIATMGDGRQSTAPELPAVVETVRNLIAVGWVILIRTGLLPWFRA
jgi:tripartite-type tricarboxylate transporter receptor subunit TctC